VPPEVRTPRFRARSSREIISPCFPHLILATLLVLRRFYRIKSIVIRLRHRIVS